MCVIQITVVLMAVKGPEVILNHRILIGGNEGRWDAWNFGKSDSCTPVFLHVMKSLAS